MKVLLFTLEYPPFKGGVANVYENIYKHWPSSVVETRCCASPVLTRHTKKTRRAASLRGDIFVLHNNDGKLINNKLPFLKWIPSVWRLWRALNNPPRPPFEEGDSRCPSSQRGYSHILVGHILPLGIVAYLVTKITGTPYSVFLHGMDLTFALKTPRKRWMAKKILNNAQNIICMNSYVGGLVKEFVGVKAVDKVKVVNPGIDKELRMTNYELRIKLIKKYNLENKIVLLSVGRLVKRKGFDIVLESLPEVLRAVPNLVYVILGDGPEIENLKFKIENLALKENTVIITDADDDERNLWYRISDIFIMPARSRRAAGSGAKQMGGCRRSETSGQRLAVGQDFEGFGIVYLEANLAGKPVIAGDSGGVRDAVRDGVNGLLVNPENIDEIKDAIIKLAKDKELRKKLGEQGRERAVKEFNWEKQVGKIYNLIIKP